MCSENMLRFPEKSLQYYCVLNNIVVGFLVVAAWFLINRCRRSILKSPVWLRTICSDESSLVICQTSYFGYEFATDANKSFDVFLMITLYVLGIVTKLHMCYISPIPTEKANKNHPRTFIKIITYSRIIGLDWYLGLVQISVNPYLFNFNHLKQLAKNVTVTIWFWYVLLTWIILFKTMHILL